MIAEVTGHEGVLADPVADLLGGGWIHRDECLDLVRYSCRRISRFQRLEIVLPDRMSPAVAARCPIACAVPETNYWYAFLRDGPRDVGNDLLNKREQPDIPLADDVEPGPSIAHMPGSVAASSKSTLPLALPFGLAGSDRTTAGCWPPAGPRAVARDGSPAATCFFIQR